MIQKLFATTVIFYIVFLSCSNNITIEPQAIVTKKSGHQVYKIDSINSYYLIYAKDSGRLFKIISEKEPTQNCALIQVDSFYKFDLISYFGHLPGGGKIPRQNMLMVTCKTFDDSTDICVEKSITDLSFGKNIKGLCYVEGASREF